MSSSDYSDAPDDVLAEIIREAEARLAAQLTVAIAADQRAMTFAGLMLAAAGALVGSALGASPSSALAASVVLTAFGLFVAATLAIVSARPVAWDYVGNQPRSWIGDIAGKMPLKNSLAVMADHYDEMITDNEAAIAGAAFWLRLSMSCALLSIFVGLVAAAGRLS